MQQTLVLYSASHRDPIALPGMIPDDCGCETVEIIFLHEEKVEHVLGGSRTQRGELPPLLLGIEFLLSRNSCCTSIVAFLCLA